MKFEEYATRFEGDVYQEAERLLGSQLPEYAFFEQQAMLYPGQCNRDVHIQALTKLYNISTLS